MNLIEKALKMLTSEQYERLMKCFDICEEQIIEYAPGQYIGVHKTDLASFYVDEQTDYWFVGRLR